MTPGTVKRDSHIFSKLIPLILGVSVLLPLLVLTAEGAYINDRPITDTGGRIHQGYLWGGNGVHEGVDFPYLTGTDVYAIADGTVVDLNESFDNNGGTGAYGNYVLIRHDQRHYNRTASQWAYVYSMYFHLSRLSVRPTLNQHVSRGEWIAEVDNSGVGTGCFEPECAHLHLQIVIDTRSDGDLDPLNLDIENDSRNPELWLSPYQDNTARVVGKVTNTSGVPQQNLIICGMNKPYQSPFGISFEGAQTYSEPWMNPDDILAENFATTDVSPGSYSIAAYNNNCSGSLYRNLGTYTFQANKTTYIGLYPMYMPLLRESSTRNSTIFTRNNSTSFTTNVATTFVRSPGSVSNNHHQTNNLPPHDHISIPLPSSNFFGSARVLGSQDEVVGAQIEYCSGSYCEPAGYSGITAELGVGTKGWEIAGTTIYLPLVKNQYLNRTSEIYVTNVGTDNVSFTVTYYDTAGNSYGGGTHSLAFDATKSIRILNSAPQNAFYSARIVSLNGQPLAVAVLEGDGNPPSSRPAIYNGFSAGHTTLYAPIVKKEYPNMGTPSESTTGITVQNITASTATVTAYYYNDDGGLVATINFQVPPYSPYVLYNPPDELVPTDFLGSVRLDSNRNIVGQMSESNITVNGGRRMMSSLALGNAASRTIAFPLWYDHYTVGGRDWVYGVNVRHAGSSGATTVTARWYNASGSQVCSLAQTLDNQHDITTFYNESCPASIGSLVLESASQNIVAVASCADSAKNNFVDDNVQTVNGSNR